MKKRPDYGNAKPEDLARALLRPVRRDKQPNPKHEPPKTIRCPPQDRGT